jgi:hypothetical protein
MGGSGGPIGNANSFRVASFSEVQEMLPRVHCQATCSVIDFVFAIQLAFEMLYGCAFVALMSYSHAGIFVFCNARVDREGWKGETHRPDETTAAVFANMYRENQSKQ